MRWWLRAQFQKKKSTRRVCQNTSVASPWRSRDRPEFLKVRQGRVICKSFWRFLVEFWNLYIEITNAQYEPVINVAIRAVCVLNLVIMKLMKLLRAGSQKYRGFKRKGACLLGYNIITVPNRRYGLKRRSGTFGSISDLNVGSVQWSRWWKYCFLARHHTNLKNPHTNRFCMVAPHSEQ